MERANERMRERANERTSERANERTRGVQHRLATLLFRIQPQFFSGSIAERSPERECRWQRLSAEYALLHEVTQWELLVGYGAVPMWMLSVGRSSCQLLLHREQGLIAAGRAYVLFRRFQGGQAVKPSCIAFRSAREALKLMRDVLAWRCFSNGGASSEEAYRQRLDIAFEGSFREDKDLVSKMMLLLLLLLLLLRLLVLSIDFQTKYIHVS